MPARGQGPARSRSHHASLILLVGLALLVGCAPETSAVPAADQDSPGPVALRYVDALFSGDTQSARSLVEPGSQTAFRLVALGVKPNQLRADVQVGSTKINDDDAVVTMVGKMCRIGAKSSGATPAENCVSNTDPASGNPIFKVALRRQPDRKWLVRLALPALSGEPAPESSAATTASVR